MMKNSLSFKFCDLSTYRDLLMGLGILGVLVAHALAWIGITDGFIYKILNLFSRLIFVEGFLFLSGFGVYYSLMKDEKYISFQKKRFWRVLFPFMLITFPLYLIHDIFFLHSLGLFFLDITSVSFWFYGNNGMWYISVSILLYFLSPFIFKIMNLGKKQYTLFGLIFICVAFCELLRIYFYEYYQLVNIGILRMPMFILGMYCGYCSWMNKSLKISHWLILVFAFVFIVALKEKIISYTSISFIAYYESLFRLFCILLLCAIFNIIGKRWVGKVGIILKWFGKYTLELYILHMSFYIMFELLFPEMPKSIVVSLILLLSVIICCPVRKLVVVLSKKLQSLSI